MSRENCKLPPVWIVEANNKGGCDNRGNLLNVFLITVIYNLLSIILNKTSFMLLLYEKRITVTFPVRYIGKREI